MTDSATLDLANQYRRSGQNTEAEVLYDKLLSKDPLNVIYLFNKGLNNTMTDPHSALDLFEKVVTIDPNQVSAYRNVRILSDQTQQHQRGLTLLTNFLKKNPGNVEVLYEKAVLLGNSGDDLNCLLNLYYVLEFCLENEHPPTLTIDQIIQDIAFSKVQLRNKTFKTWIQDMSIHNAYRGKELIEFSYELPSELFGNENYYFLEGKYEGISIRDLIESDPHFLNDSIINLEYFFVTEEIVEMLAKKGVDVSKSRVINTVKIQTKESENFSDLFDEEDNEEDEDEEIGEEEVENSDNMENFTDVFRVAFKHGQPNPLNIQVDHPLYGSVRLPDMTETFENDLRGFWGRLENTYEAVRRVHVLALLRYYFFDLLIEFKEKSNNQLPAQIVDDVFNQVMQAYRNMAAGDLEDTIRTVRQHVSNLFYDPDIINDTRRYMRTFN